MNLRKQIRRACILLFAAVSVLCAAGCGEKVTAEGLLSGAAAAPGMRANLSVRADFTSGTKEQTAKYEGIFSAKDNVRYLKGLGLLDNAEKEIEYYIRYLPGQTPEEDSIEVFAYRKKDGIWKMSPYEDTMDSLQELFSSVQNPVLGETGKNAPSYTVSGTIPLEVIRNFAVISHTGRGIAAIIMQMPMETPLRAELSFSAMNQMPTVMKCVLPAPLEFGEKTLTAFEIQLAITDMTLASLEIPPEVLEDAE